MVSPDDAWQRAYIDAVQTDIRDLKTEVRRMGDLLTRAVAIEARLPAVEAAHDRIRARVDDLAATVEAMNRRHADLAVEVDKMRPMADSWQTAGVFYSAGRGVIVAMCALVPLYATARALGWV